MRFLPLLLVAFLFAGCVASASKISQISLGMTKAQVVVILGQPKSVSARADGTELLRYELSGRNAPLLNPNAKNFSDGYTVQLHSGKVVAYGRDDEFRAIQIRTN